MGYEKELKKLYIKENDERTIMIMQRTGAIGINMFIIGLGFGTIIAGFFNEIVFFTLLVATLVTSLVKGLFKIYVINVQLLFFIKSLIEYGKSALHSMIPPNPTIN